MSPTTTPHRPPPGGLRLVLILGALTALGPLTIDMYLPAFPSLAESLGSTVASVQLTLATYLAGLAAGQFIYGPLADRMGRRVPLLGGLSLYSVASLVCAVSPSVPLLAGARFVQALGGCAGMVISRAIVRDCFDERGSARLFSSLMLVMGIAPILAPSLGSQILRVAGWRALFVVLAVAGLAAMALIAFALPESLAPERRVRRTARETLRSALELLTHARFVRLSLAGGVMQAAMFAYISGSPFVFMKLFGMPPERYSVVFGMNALGLIAASQMNRLLVRRFEVVSVLRGAILVAAAAYAVLLTAALSGAGLSLFIPAIFVGVAAVGLVLPNATAAAMAPYATQAGIASALLGTLQSVCAAAAAVAVSALSDGTSRPMTEVMFGCGVLALMLVGVGRARVYARAQ